MAKATTNTRPRRSSAYMPIMKVTAQTPKTVTATQPVESTVGGLAGLLEITDAGREFSAADILANKELFAQHAYQHAPLVRAICNALATTIDGSLGERFFLDLLRRSFGEQDAQRQLELTIDWGRYGELYEYDADSGQLIREHALTQELTA